MQPVIHHAIALPPSRSGAIVRSFAAGAAPDAFVIGRYISSATTTVAFKGVEVQNSHAELPSQKVSERRSGGFKRYLQKVVSRLRGRVMPSDGLSYAAMLRAEGRMTIGDHCSISPGVNITDPDYVVMGSNVRLSDCSLFGHDGSINMINRAMATTFDAVGPIVIGDNVFIGHGAIVLPGTNIESNTIIGAGSVVKGQVEGGHVYAGSPLRAISTFEAHLQKLEGRDRELPGEWRRLLKQRAGAFDPGLEPRLVELRRAYFFGAPA